MLSKDVPTCLRVVYAQRQFSAEVATQGQSEQSVASTHKYNYPVRRMLSVINS